MSGGFGSESAQLSQKPKPGQNITRLRTNVLSIKCESIVASVKEKGLKLEQHWNGLIIGDYRTANLKQEKLFFSLFFMLLHKIIILLNFIREEKLFFFLFLLGDSEATAGTPTPTP